MADTFGRGPQLDSGFFRIAAMHEALQELRLAEETRASKAAVDAARSLARKAGFQAAKKV